MWSSHLPFPVGNSELPPHQHPPHPHLRGFCPSDGVIGATFVTLTWPSSPTPSLLHYSYLGRTETGHVCVHSTHEGLHSRPYTQTVFRRPLVTIESLILRLGPSGRNVTSPKRRKRVRVLYLGSRRRKTHFIIRSVIRHEYSCVKQRCLYKKEWDRTKTKDNLSHLCNGLKFYSTEQKGLSVKWFP